MDIEFDILNERLEWYEKCSLFVKRGHAKQFGCISTNSEKTKITQLESILTHLL